MDFMEMSFLKVINMSITASYVILAVLLIRLCIGRTAKIFSYVLWSVVAFRLLSPVSFSSTISIFNIKLFDMTAAQSGASGTFTYVPSDIAYLEIPQVTVGIPAVNHFIVESLPAATPSASVNLMQIVVSCATILWCIGIVALLVYSIISYVRIKHKVDGAVLLDRNIYECDNIPSPFVLGLINPRIYIPFRMNKQQRAYIFCHEEHHIKRLDNVIKPLSFMLLAVYWFNPLVWVAYFCMCRDMEMSCDEKVLFHMGMSIKNDYSRSLLSFSAKNYLSVASPLAFGETEAKTRVKNILNFKKPKAWMIALTIILCISVIAACAANPETETGAMADIYGYYEFDENVYTNPLSSFIAVKGFMPYFGITERALLIIDNRDGSLQEFAAVFKKESMSKKDFEGLFESDWDMPDISQYRKRAQYAVFSAEGAPEYRLYVMDGEIWLATLAGGRMWSIYHLVKTEAVSTSPEGETDGSMVVLPDEGFVLEICFGDSVSDAVVLRDEKSISAIKDIIFSHSSASARGYNVDVETVGSYLRFYDRSDPSQTMYYAFSNIAISDEPQIQVGKDRGGDTRAGMPGKQFEALYALWESHQVLPESVIVTSGDHSAAASVYFGSSVTPQEVKGQLSYLTINPMDDYCPFRVYANGLPQYGHYEIYDAITFEKLDFIRPSGLEPQTYILANAVAGRSYIIEMSSGYWVGDRIYGTKILFGVSLP